MKICIDPGHGGKDSGASGFGLQEKDINLDIALKLEAMLKEKGFQVFMTRRNDVLLPPNKRTEVVNSFNCDVTLSIHNNAYTSSKAKGSEVIYPYQSDKGRMLAEIILDNLVELGLKGRRIYYRLNSNKEDYYYMIRNIVNLSLIVECAFITNEEDNQLLSTSSFRTKLAEGLSDALVFYREKTQNNKEHWAKDYFEELKAQGLVLAEHDLDSEVTWGELATLITRLLNKET